MRSVIAIWQTLSRAGEVFFHLFHLLLRFYIPGTEPGGAMSAAIGRVKRGRAILEVRDVD